MKEIKLETKCPKCEHVFLTTCEESVSPSEAELADAVGQLANANTNLADTAKMLEERASEVVSLKEEIERLESEEHAQEIITHWLNQDFEGVDPVVKVELGRKLGLTKMFEEAELVEEKEPVAIAGAKASAILPEVVWADPQDDHYDKVPNMPIWFLGKVEKGE